MKSVAGVCLALLIAGTNARAACTDVEIAFAETAISNSERERLAQDLRVAVDKVCRWWGPTYSGRLTIEVPDADGPSMALIPAWRGKPGTMVFPAAVVRRGTAATVHEIVHVFAPSANRFLAEGLAVHAHDRLAGPRAFPNFGRDLHRAAGRHASGPDIAALERLATPAMLQLPSAGGRQAAYLVSGSFVRYLIDRYDMEQFRKLYAMTPFMPKQRNVGEPARWLQVYGRTLDELAQDWRKALPAAQ
jgi:hypothetical protein